MDNDVIKEYMAKRQEMFAQQKQAKRRWEGTNVILSQVVPKSGNFLAQFAHK